MSDESLRRLERKLRTTGSSEEEARLLRERMRIGEIARERVALAAWCGHEASRLALGPEAPLPPHVFRAWGAGFAPFGDEALVRVALAAARFVSGALHRSAAKDKLRSAETWARSPTSARPTEPIVYGGIGGLQLWSLPVEREQHEELAAEARDHAFAVAVKGEVEDVCLALSCAEIIEGEAAVREAVADEVVPWALGLLDPLERWPS